MEREGLILRHTTSPGDIVVMTALVRDIHRAYPERFDIEVITPGMEIWKHNPHVTNLRGRKVKRNYKLSYGRYLRLANNDEVLHFVGSFHRDFEDQSGFRVPLTEPKPDLHLSDQEKAEPIVEPPYWVIVAGGKTDYTAKHWSYQRAQKVVDLLRGTGIRVVQVGSLDRGPPAHRHPRLEGVLGLLGKTNLRELFNVIYHSEGVICGVTLAMHVAAAFDKPCVVWAGGREHYHWEAYSNGHRGFGPCSGRVKVEHRYLHTIGQLDCCIDRGCWRNKATRNEGDSSFCTYPVAVEGDQVIPICLDAISAEQVYAAVMSYYLPGQLHYGKMDPMLVQAKEPLTVPVPEGGWIRLRVEEATQPPSPAQPVQIDPPRLLKETRGKKIDMKKVSRADYPVPRPGRRGVALIDHPHIGGHVTLCMTAYGNYFPMHKRCLEAICKTTPEDRLEIRLAANAPGLESHQYFQHLHESGRIRVYKHFERNVRKYPAMRSLFWDKDNPIEDKWVIWFDDDTMCDKREDWLDLLLDCIVHHPDCDLFGPRYFFRLSKAQIEWIRSASWYKGRPFRDRRGQPSPNGNVVHFATGSFWAISKRAIVACDIPDTRLRNNGGDIAIGEAVWQNGFKMQDFGSRKTVVEWSSVPRRGASETIFGI